MADVFETVENVGFGSRMKNSIMGALFGLACLVAAFPLHFWNEGRAVKEHAALQEGASSVVDAAIAPVDAAKEGKLVHVSGKATASQPVTDAQFGFTVQALALERKVEMFQWRETKKTRSEKKLGGGERKITEYSYDTGWDDDVIDSQRFEHADGHKNPGQMPFTSTRVDATPVKIGDLVLAPSFTQRLEGDERATPKLSDLPPNLGATFQVDNAYLSTSKKADAPEVGDVRVSWTRVPEQEVSVIGRQQNGAVDTYSASNGREIALLQTGTVAAKDMFQAAESRNSRITWILRGVGTFIMWLGFTLSLGWIGRIADVVPFIGTLVESGIALVSALLAVILSALTIAVAWFFYRPFIAVGLVLLAGFAIYLLRRRTKQPPPPPQGMSAPPPPPPMAPPPLPRA